MQRSVEQKESPRDEQIDPIYVAAQISVNTAPDIIDVAIQRDIVALLFVVVLSVAVWCQWHITRVVDALYILLCRT